MMEWHEVELPFSWVWGSTLLFGTNNNVEPKKSDPHLWVDNGGTPNLSCAA